MTRPKRVETDNLKRLEEMRVAFEKLQAERIRAEGEAERLTRELEEARELARAEFGTDDENEIQRLIDAATMENARLVEEFGEALRNVEARLRQIGGES